MNAIDDEIAEFQHLDDITAIEALRRALAAAVTWAERNGIADVPELLIIVNMLPEPGVGAWRVGLPDVGMRRPAGAADTELCAAVAPAVAAILRAGGAAARAVLARCGGELARLRAVVDPARGCVALQEVGPAAARVVGMLSLEHAAGEVN